MQWWLYAKQKEAEPPDFSAGGLIFVYVVVIAICLFVRSATWPDNKHVNLLFFLPSVVLPFLVITALVYFVSIFKSSVTHYAEIRKFIARSREYHLKKYARKNIVIAGWSIITPLEQPALNMLKLEGEFPLAPKTPLRIEQESAFEYSRNEQVFTRLIGPLAERLKDSRYCSFEATVWVQGGDESCGDELRRTLERFDVPGARDCKIECLQDCPGYVLINQWIEKTNARTINHLIIIIDIYAEGSQSKCMDSACAFLLTSRCVSVGGEKPVYLYQPMAGVSDVEVRVPVYLHTRPVASPKTLWYTGLSGTEKYPLFKALDEHKLVPGRLDIEKSLGEQSAGYRWLVLALAADAIKYAQGEQLVAASDNNQFGIAALSSCNDRKPDDFKGFEHTQPWLCGGMSGMLLTLSFLVYQLSFFDSKHLLPFWGFLAGIFIPPIVGLTVGLVATWYGSKNARTDMGW